TASGMAHLRCFLYLPRSKRAAAPAFAWGSWPAEPPCFFFQVMVIFPPAMLSVSCRRVYCPHVCGRSLSYYSTQGVTDNKNYFSFLKFSKRHSFPSQIFHRVFTFCLQSLQVRAAAGKTKSRPGAERLQAGSQAARQARQPRVMIQLLRW